MKSHQIKVLIRKGRGLLVEQMVINLDLGIGSKVLWQEHNWNVHMAQLVNLQQNRINNPLDI